MAHSARRCPGRKTVVMRADGIPRQARTHDRPRPCPNSPGRCGEDPSGDPGLFSASPLAPSLCSGSNAAQVCHNNGRAVSPVGPGRTPPAKAQRTVGNHHCETITTAWDKALYAGFAVQSMRVWPPGEARWRLGIRPGKQRRWEWGVGRIVRPADCHRSQHQRGGIGGPGGRLIKLSRCLCIFLAWRSRLRSRAKCQLIGTRRLSTAAEN
jgi:hypothetical protein